MKELLTKLESIPWADNKVRPVFDLLEKYEDLKNAWLPKLKYLEEVSHTWKTKSEINKWDWIYDKVTNAILTYYCYSPWLGNLELLKDNEVIGIFNIKLPLPVDPWAFEINNEYDLVGVLDGRIKIITTTGFNLVRQEWNVGDLKYRLKQS